MIPNADLKGHCTTIMRQFLLEMLSRSDLIRNVVINALHFERRDWFAVFVVFVAVYIVVVDVDVENVVIGSFLLIITTF